MCIVTAGGDDELHVDMSVIVMVQLLMKMMILIIRFEMTLMEI